MKNCDVRITQTNGRDNLYMNVSVTVAGGYVYVTLPDRNVVVPDCDVEKVEIHTWRE